VEIKVLGSLHVGRGPMTVTPTASKPRTVLALLLLNESMVVPTSALVGELWADTPPKSAPTTVQTYILQLRKMLAAATGLSLAEVAETILRTKVNGYLFEAPLGSLDLAGYSELERVGMRAMAAGDRWAAVRALRAALQLWRGPALPDVRGGRLIEAGRAKLEQSRLTMLDYRIELELRLGLHRQILGELNALVRRYPYHEDLTAQFIVALYRSGRRDYALDLFRRLCRTMIDELGLEPSPKLCQLVRALVDRDPTLVEMPVVPLPVELPMVPSPRAARSDSRGLPVLAGRLW
jgi:DNA-binding SARP family transcriptional activator